MELEILEQFQNDLNELNAFDEFLNMERIMRNINCRQFTNLCVSAKKRHIHRRNGGRRRRFSPMMDLTEEEFQHRYRFSKDNMKKLVEMVKDDLEIEQQQQCGRAHKHGSQVPVDKQIMAAVRYWGRTEHPEITAQIHGITLRTLMKISKRVAEALSYKGSRYIRMPCLLVEKEKVAKAFYDLARMPQVIGAVNHTKIKCKRLKGLQGTQELQPEDVLHIQIVSDANLKIRDLDCHLIRSTTSSIKTPSDMFALSRIKERFEQNEFRGRLLLGDSALKCSSYLYTPVPYAITMAEQAFNSSQRLTYEPARRCLNLWQQRFGILNDEFYGSPTTVRHIVVALVLLHNMAVEWEDTAIGAHISAEINSSPLLETTQSADERSRAEFIKNHFYSFIH